MGRFELYGENGKGDPLILSLINKLNAGARATLDGGHNRSDKNDDLMGKVIPGSGTVDLIRVSVRKNESNTTSALMTTNGDIFLAENNQIIEKLEGKNGWDDFLNLT